MFEFEVTPRAFKTFSYYTGARMVGGFIINIDPTLTIRQRAIYNFLDFLGDVGGLQEALNRIGSVFLYFFGVRSL